MQLLDAQTKFAHLGKPGLNFSKGFSRRLKLVEKKVDLQNKTILDQGCGMGVWMEQFKNYTAPENIFGSDIDQAVIDSFQRRNQKLEKNQQIPQENVHQCTAETLTFDDNMFDIVFSHEVLEHVENDAQSLQEIMRVLKPGGVLIMFTPNRGWPFETHGMFFRGKYVYGNIPFLPWLPKFFYRKLAPHVRNYGHWEIRRLLQRIKHNDHTFTFQHHSHVFPAFDKLERKFGFLGKFMQEFFHTAEKTPLHFFGISHFIIAEKGVSE